MQPKFEIDPTNLDKSAAAALEAHTSKRLSYPDWRAVMTRIGRLRVIETFRRQHGHALHSAQHPEHLQRTTELRGLYENAYPDESAAGA